MKKTLLLGTALMVCVAGFSQSTTKKAINPKYLQKKAMYGTKKAVESQPTANGTKTTKANRNGHNATTSACTNQNQITTSWNCFGVGGGSTTSSQNCLSYNSDLNTLIWTQRGSSTWALNTTSGCMQSTLVNPATGMAIDSIVEYSAGSTTNLARYPSGVLINTLGNTDRTKAYAVAIGQVTNGTDWIGAAYVAKPLWSHSAVTHANPTIDSLFTPTGTGIFGNCAASNLTGAPATDLQALSDGKTAVSVGITGDPSITAADASAIKGALFVKATVVGTGTVNWSSSSITPPVRSGALGYNLTEPRMAFGPDGMHGYILFLGVLNTVYGNYCDSSMTPILYQTTDGGTTWNQVLAGYNWMGNHPEVEKNVGELVGDKRFYTFNMNENDADLVVDAKNVLHFVTTVSESTFLTQDIDSLGIYSPLYNYDFVNYHPIIWDFSTDGTCWKTMMVDSIITSPCGSDATDTTSTFSPMGGSQILGVSAHITVSRSADGTKVFYGWADSDPGVTGYPYNTNPDILMKAYDVASGMVSATKHVTNGLGACFFPYLSDISYFDASQSAWVVPAVYTTPDVIVSSSPVTIYDASSQADYYFTNCGTFTSAELSSPAVINNPLLAGACSVGIKTNNAFASSIGNYPNPFNNTTTISVTLSENKAVDVKIYNAIGSLIYSKKVNGNVGENEVTFDGSALSSGVYYYTVTAGNEQATKKMIIQK